MLCTHKTASSASLVIQKFVPTLLTHISPNSRPFLVGIVSTTTSPTTPRRSIPTQQPPPRHPHQPVHATPSPQQPSNHHSTPQTRRPTSLPTLNANDTIATAPGTHNEPPTLHHLEPHPKHTNNRRPPPQPHINRPNTQQKDFVQQGATPQT